jgi:hypothetical protein
MVAPSARPRSPTQTSIVSMTAGGIEGLIAHYGTEAPLASAQLSRVAQR